MSTTDQPAAILENRLWQPMTIRWFTVIFGAAVLYSVVRYHIAGDVEWQHFPLFILNKATALAVGDLCCLLVLDWPRDQVAQR